MYDRYCGESGAAKGRVGEALKFIWEMIDAEPAYVRFAPKFKETFEQLENYPPDYIAHEYLNLDWDLIYFADVAEISQAVKLDFATTAAQIENVDDSFFSAKARDFLNKIDNPIVREQTRDYFVNRQFRKDIYVRGLRRLKPVESLEKLLATRYVLMLPAENVPQKFNYEGINISLAPEIFGSLLEYLQEENFRPKNLLGYLERNPSINVTALIEVVTILVNNQKISPCQSEKAVELVKNSCERLKAHICERSQTDDTIKFLSSPLTGGGVMLNCFQQLFLEQAKRGNLRAEKLAAEVWKIFSARGERLISEGKVIESPEKNLAELKNWAENFLSKEFPIFKALSL